MATAVYLEYTIVLRDKAQVETLQAAQSRWNNPRNLGGALRTYNFFGRPYGGYGKLYASPERAALEFPGCVIRGFGTSDPMPTGPYIASIHIWANSLPGRWPTDEDVFTRPRLPSTFFGGNITYVWYGVYVYAPAVAPTVPPGETAIEPIRQLRWAEGFDIPTNGIGGDAATIMNACNPGSSRHLNGYGMLISEHTANSVKIHTIDEFRTGLKPAASWERLYMRLDSYPSATMHFWRWGNSLSATQEALVLSLSVTGNISVFNQTAASTYVYIGSTPALPAPDLRQWVKVDVIAGTGASALNAGCKIYFDGVLVLDIAGFPNDGWGAEFDGIGQPSYHIQSELGKIDTSGASVGGALSVDDWTNHDVPVSIAAANNDWLNGTKVVRLDPAAYNVLDHNAAVWSKDIGHFLPLPAVSGINTNYQTSNNATGPKFSVLLDIKDRVLNDSAAINGGIIAAFFGIYNGEAAGAAAGTLDYSIDGGAFVAQSIIGGGSTTVLGWKAKAYLPSLLEEPLKVTTLGLRYSPGASAHNRTIGAIGAAAVVCGVFGKEDLDAADETPPVVPTNRGQHQHWYDRSAWGIQKIAPAAPVVTQTGTYVGNGTVTRLEFPFPVTFFHVRRVTATVQDGVTWWPSMVGASHGWQREMSVEGAIRSVWELADPPPAEGDLTADGQCILTIAGSLEIGGLPGAANENGVTYQYLAIMDPGARLTLAGSIRHPVTASGVSRTTLLAPAFGPVFSPVAGFFMKPDVAVSGTFGGFYKGPGHAASAISRLDSAETATALSWAEGVLTNVSGFNNTVTLAPTSFHLFRLDDSSDDPGILKTLQITSYVGDGSGSRNLGLSPTGQRPMWAMVVPHNAPAIFRDPSHTGSNSSLLVTAGATLTNTTTGITAGGIDQLFLGSSLNANGIVYDVIVFMGCADAGNGGWSVGCTVSAIVPIPPPCDPAVDEDCGEACEDDDCECTDCECVGDDCDEEVPCDPEVEDCEPTPCDPETEDCEDCEGDDCAPIEFGSQCVAGSQKVCNMALSHIGINQVLVNVVTDETREATMCRLHYAEAVDQCLRMFPWDFATAYADLQWEEGTDEAPVNHDWTYLYRLPTDFVYPRRIAEPSRGRTMDTPNPPQFRMAASDATGKLLYTNYADPTWDATVSRPVQLTLEYTFRPSCVATAGDALFKLALSYVLASFLAPSLARNKVTAAECMTAARGVMIGAKTTNANAQQQDNTPGDADWIKDR